MVYEPKPRKSAWEECRDSLPLSRTPTWVKILMIVAAIVLFLAGDIFIKLAGQK
jgi:hypothetical protein